MKLRWLQCRKIITSEMVKEYAEKNSVGLMQAKKELGSSDTVQVLQYRTWYGQWRNVPHIVEYLK